MAKLLNITEAVTIALHSMIIITQNDDKQVNVNFISDQTGSSKYHVAKILQKLVKDGFLGSHRGPAGGFYLLHSPHDLTLLEIYEAIEGKIVNSRCPMNKAKCPFGDCVFEDMTIKMTEEFVNYLKNHTLAYYMDKKEEGRDLTKVS